MKHRLSFTGFALVLLIAFVSGGRLYAQDDDFGDAPDPTYPTLQASGGAQHGIGSLRMGVNIDADPDGQPSAAADGDDLNPPQGPDDEDGVWFPNALIPGVPYAVDVTINGAGANAYLQGWIDFDGNGSWADPGEQIITNMSVANTIYTIPFNVPSFVAAGTTYARFRVSTQQNLPDSGYVPDGEVEDYALDIDQIKWLQPPNLTETGVDVDTDVELADDWLCTYSGPVSDIHIWGSFFGDDEAVDLFVLQNISFVLNIYADIPDPDGPGPQYSMPGQLLWSQPFGPGSYHAGLRIPVPSGEWWHNPNALPPNDWIPQADFNCYQFDFYPLPGEEFVQTNGNVYWLGVQVLDVPDGELFGWKSTDLPNHWNDDAVWWDGAGWQELRYGGLAPPHPYAEMPENSLDLSFAVSTPDQEEEYEHKMHYAQPPDPNGWDVRACLVPATDLEPETRKVLADDFMCMSNGFINHITFWGSWASNYFDEAWPYQGITNIHLSIHSDEPQGPHGHSQPDVLLWEFDLNPAAPPLDWVVPDPYWEEPSWQGWYDPNTQFFEENNHTNYYRYDIFIPNQDAFEQVEGTIYWLDISVETIAGLWGWKTSITNWNDDAVWADLPIIDPDQWMELFDPIEGHSLDLAFLINEIPHEEEYDFGDAPDGAQGTGPGDYETRLADNGAYHFVVPLAPYFDDGSGTDQPDTEADGQPDPNALGDDISGTSPDDEDGILFPASLVASKNTTVEIWVDDGQGGAGAGQGWVDAWIDFNGDGSWTNAGEQIYSGWMPQGSNSVPFLVPAGSVIGQTFARFRINSTGSPLAPTGGPAQDGEVEDHEVYIEEPPVLLDYGDAPQIYPTLLASNGASHVQTTLYLGNLIDVEPDGQPTFVADGDDANNLADEDGVFFPTALISGTPGAVNVAVTGGPGYLQGWIDWNADGDWADASEQIITDAWVGSGITNLPFSVPTWATNLLTFARFRISSTIGLPEFGPAQNGEVEDYPVQLEELKWLQIPEQGPEGVDVNNTLHQLADDFECTASGPITDIHIWGSFFGDVLPPEGPGGLDFRLSIWSDVPAGVDADYSHPGQELWARDFKYGSYYAGRIWHVAEGEWWHDPGSGIWIPGADNNIYQFDFYPDPATAFLQVEGTIYWLAVEYSYDEVGPVEFGWKTTPDAFNDDAVYWDSANPPIFWKDLYYEPPHPRQGESLELAFALSGTEVDVEDWGDAPDPPYRTYSSSVGARHIIISNFCLGTVVDAEWDGQPTPAADGDDVTVFDDEDGVALGSLVRGSNTAVNVYLTSGAAGGILDAWVDFNGSGIFGDVMNEQVFTGQALTPGPNALSFGVPSNAALGTNYARFRLTQTGIASPAGAAADGEVEDYMVILLQPAPSPDIVITNIFFNVSNTIATVEWNAQSGITYQMLNSTNLLNSNGWMNVGAYVTGPANWQTNSTAPTNQFYRIIAPWTP